MIVAQLARAFLAPTPVTQTKVHDMAAALRGLEAIIQKDFYRIPSALKATFNSYGAEFWGVVQQAAEGGLIERTGQTETFAQIGMDLGDVAFSFAFWRCRLALRSLTATGINDPVASNGKRLISFISQWPTESTKAQLEQVSRTDEGREMLADALARWTNGFQVPYTN